MMTFKNHVELGTKYKDTVVVVTGGSGFIGINLIKALVNEGARVTSIDIKEPPPGSIPAKVKIIKGDVRNIELYKKTLSECDYCFHLAARTDLLGKTLSDYSFNYNGVEELVDGLKSNRRLKRLVFFSTQLVVGNFNETRFIDEFEPYRTKTLYGQSKILGEKALIEKCYKYELPYTIIRPTSVYGPYGNEPYRDFFLTIKKGRYFHIGKANNLISMVYVQNLISQTLFLALHPKAENRVYFGNDLYPYTMRQFSDMVAAFWKKKLISFPDIIIYPLAYFLGLIKLFGVPVPLYPFRLNNIKSTYCYSIKNSLDLGYIPQFTLSDGVVETLKWYDENDISFKETYASK
jgi:nucleoside-diphosphate-sugar epimerase